MLVWVSSVLAGLKTPLSDAYLNFNLQVVSPGFELKGEGVCRSLTHYNQIKRKKGSRQPWSAFYPGEGNTDEKLTGAQDHAVIVPAS